MTHHAIYDDGDITFVAVNDEPRIVFAHRFDDDFRDSCLSETEKYIEKRNFELGRDRSYEIKVLDIKPNEFGSLYDAFQREDIKRCFLNDAETHDVEFAVKHYRQYNCFCEEWINEVDAGE